jgi:DNA-binding NtrC family response regulator
MKGTGPLGQQAFAEKLSIEDYAKNFIITHQGDYTEQQLANMLGITRKSLWEKRKKWNSPRK